MRLCSWIMLSSELLLTDSIVSRRLVARLGRTEVSKTSRIDPTPGCTRVVVVIVVVSSDSSALAAVGAASAMPTSATPVASKRIGPRRVNVMVCPFESAASRSRSMQDVRDAALNAVQ